jgi:acetolactate synthase small subunit
MEEQAFLNLIKMTAENHGCRIVDVDLENHVLNLDGPDEAVDACARAIADVLGQ